MKNFTTDAINIKTYPLSEHDNIVVMFSRQKGLIKGVAKGVKRPKSKLGARMQMLVANKLMLYEGKNLDTICQAQALNTFGNLRRDLDKLTYSIYLAEIIGIFCTEKDDEQDNERIYELFYKTLEGISGAEDLTGILLYVLKFQLKFMNILGYGIELETCLVCGCTIVQDPLFSTAQGGVVCEKCNADGSRVKIPTKIREFLLEITKTNIDETTKYDELVNEKVAHTCHGLLKRYIDTISPRRVKTLKVIEAVGY